MTDNRTTELLCKLLEERGLSCQTHYLHASWRVGPKLYEAMDDLNGTLTVDNLTPEQAIAATLGSEPQSMRTFDSIETALSIAEKEVEIEQLRRENAELCKENEELTHRRAELEAATLGSGRLTAEQVCEAIFNGSSYASYDGAKYYADGINMQAIADELNSRAERTCKFVSSKGSDYPPVCSACGYELGIYDCEWFEDGTYGYDGNYCPNCGAKVMSE